MTLMPPADVAASPETRRASRGLHKAALGAIFTSHLAVDMQTSSLAVLLPPLLTAFQLTYASAAAIISANNIIIAVAQPIFGIVGDYRPARWLVPVGTALCGLAMASVLYLPNYWLVIAAVLLSGLGSAAFHPEALSSVRAVSGDRIATGSSVFFFAGNLGFAFGPLAASLLLDHLGQTGLLWMFLPIALGLAALWTQRRVYTAPAEVEADAPRALGLTRPRRVTLWRVGFLLLFITVRLTVSGGLPAFIPLYFSANSALTRTDIAQLLTVLSISGTVGTLLSGPLADRIGRRRVVVVTMLISIAALALFLRTTGLAQLVVLAVAGAALSAPWTLSVIMMQEALPSNVGLASGLSLGTAYGAMGLSVALLGQLADAFGLLTVMQLLVALPAVVLLMGFFVPERSN